MIVRCPECHSTYEVTAHKLPESGLQVKCPRCKAVFPAAPSTLSEPRPSPPARPSPADAAPAPHPVPPRPRRRITDPALARRMARAMISEMLLNRRLERDASRQDGTVLSAFGPAIAAAFDIYRDKVSPDLAVAPRLFREAVNDILGGEAPLL